MSYRRILLGTDFSPGADAALRVAVELAARLGSELRLLHAHGVQGLLTVSGFVPPTPESYEAAREAATAELGSRREIARAGGVSAVRVQLVDDAPASALLRLAEGEGVDLIVVGTHGRSGVARAVLGSVAELVIRSAPCPVVSVRFR